MADLMEFLGMIYGLLNTKMDIYGFMVSFWDIIMFTLVLGVLLKFAGYLFYEN